MAYRFTSRPMALLSAPLIALLGCDGTNADTSPSESNLTQIKAVSPNQGAAQVEVIFNSPPQVTSITSSDGRVASNMPVTLQAVATDPDVEALQMLGDHYTQRGKFQQGLRVDEQLSRRFR